MADELHIWETLRVVADGQDITQRMPVPGGWIYRCLVEDRGKLLTPMVFVPEPCK